MRCSCYLKEFFNVHSFQSFNNAENTDRHVKHRSVFVVARILCLMFITGSECTPVFFSPQWTVQCTFYRQSWSYLPITASDVFISSYPTLLESIKITDQNIFGFGFSLLALYRSSMSLVGCGNDEQLHVTHHLLHYSPTIDQETEKNWRGIHSRASWSVQTTKIDFIAPRSGSFRTTKPKKRLFFFLFTPSTNRKSTFYSSKCFLNLFVVVVILPLFYPIDASRQ